MVVVVAIIVILFMVASSSIKIIYEYERGVVFLFGKYIATYEKGLRFLLPGVMTMVRVDMRLVALDVPDQDIITKDNVSISVNAVVMYKVMEAEKAVIKVGDYHYNASLLAQTTLRATVGQHELDDVLSEQDKINARLQELLDKQTDPWGLKVSTVAIKHVDLPQEMKRAMAKQAEAERERRAKVINAEGELQASEKLSQAAEVMGRHNVTIQLRYLQTLREIATENNSVTVFPFPIDLLAPFINAAKQVK
jgi:regulator of protease activity HflC (stomatin/prohibitin superfamily)